MTHPDIEKRVIGIIADFGGTASDSEYNEHAIQVLSRLCAEEKEAQIPIPEDVLADEPNAAASIASKLMSSGYDEVASQPSGQRAFFGAFQFSEDPDYLPRTSVSLVVVEELVELNSDKTDVSVTEAVYLFNFPFTGSVYDVERENKLKSQQAEMIDWNQSVESPGSSEPVSLTEIAQEQESAIQEEFIGHFMVRVSPVVWDELMDLWEKGDGPINVTGDSAFGRTIGRLTGYDVPMFQVAEPRKLERSNPLWGTSAVITVEYRGTVSELNKPLKNVTRRASVIIYPETSTPSLSVKG